MQYGLIGEKLSHSFSKDIHGIIAGYDYELSEIPKYDLDRFFSEKDFRGVNVTIPYKKSVIKYLDYIDEAARKTGAVNTVLNKGDKLYGYNTDAFGLSALIERNGISLKNKNVLILGGGGTGETALYVAESSGARSVKRVSRTKKDGFITYCEAIKLYDTEIIINTTPVGMFPDNCGMPIDLSCFERAQAVIDVIYNPINTRLVLEAKKRGIKAAGGLYMLIMQAIGAAELFTDKKIETEVAHKAYRKILSDKQNIVLIGMPSSGKTTLGKALAKSLNMPFFDSDEVITEKTGKPPAEIISESGEAAFRKKEKEVIRELSLLNHTVIATGGGAVEADENILFLKSNGVVYYIDRPVELLEVTGNRPLSSSRAALLSIYGRRKALYEAAADRRILNNKDLYFAVEEIRKDFCYEDFNN